MKVMEFKSYGRYVWGWSLEMPGKALQGPLEKNQDRMCRRTVLVQRKE